MAIKDGGSVGWIEGTMAERAISTDTKGCYVWTTRTEVVASIVKKNGER